MTEILEKKDRPTWRDFRTRILLRIPFGRIGGSGRNGSVFLSRFCARILFIFYHVP